MHDKHMKQLGFHVWCVGGVSRAWRRFQDDGSYLLVTDVGGYDLPEPNGPYQAMLLTAQDELVEIQPPFWQASRLVRWLRRFERLLERNQSALVAINDPR
jgi:hypothetical protein